MKELLRVALWFAGIAHFCILAASFQVPFRLKWKEDLSRLQPLNRKLMWTYGAFTLLMIIAFGVLTLALHNEMLQGERSALALALLIAIFWGLRVLVDIFYMSHADWPRGLRFVFAHILLTSTFVAMSTTYFTLVIWKWLYA